MDEAPFSYDPSLSYIGHRDVWGGSDLFGLTQMARSQHVAIYGQTGTGKSTLLRNLLVQDIERGHGVAIIDPHGDLADEILDCIPPERTDHVVYVNPADMDFPVGLNVLRSGNHHTPHLIASYLVGAFKSIWRDSWGPRMEHILYASLAALQECDNVTLLAVQRMLNDAAYRKWIVRQVGDPLVRAFWEVEFAGYDRRFLSEAIAPVQNKIGQLCMAPPIRHMLGQVASTVDIRFLMDNQRILIANLSKGKIGEDKANLIGSLLVTQFQLAALSRADMPPAKRIPFHLYVDEYPNFATDSFSSIMSEARKYGLCLAIGSQYTNQAKPEVTNAVFGNVGTMISFRVGYADADILARHYGDNIQPSALTELGNYRAWVRTISREGNAQSFRLTTMEPLVLRSGRRQIVINRSRDRFSTKREVVESRIRRWMGELQPKEVPPPPNLPTGQKSVNAAQPRRQFPRSHRNPKRRYLR